MARRARSRTEGPVPERRRADRRQPPREAAPFLAALSSRLDLLDVTHRLVGEFEGRVAAGAVLRCVARCRDEVLRAGTQVGLPEAVEAMARRRLELRGSPLLHRSRGRSAQRRRDAPGRASEAAGERPGVPEPRPGAD